MQTPVLSLKNLIDLMRDAAARTMDLNLRYHNETDAVLYGKVTQIDILAEGVWSNDTALAPDERHALTSAQQELTRAWEHLAASVFPQT